MPYVTAVGYAYDPETRMWSKRVEYFARNRQEALNWIKFNRDWMRDLHICNY